MFKEHERMLLRDWKQAKKVGLEPWVDRYIEVRMQKALSVYGQSKQIGLTKEWRSNRFTKACTIVLDLLELLDARREMMRPPLPKTLLGISRNLGDGRAEAA